MAIPSSRSRRAAQRIACANSGSSDDLALVVGTWSFEGTGPDGRPTAADADVAGAALAGAWGRLR
jgi:hypothetical protein